MQLGLLIKRLSNLGWTKTDNVRCGVGKWYVDQAKDKSKSYQDNVAICAKKCAADKGKCVAFDIHHEKSNQGKGGYCNLFTKEQCSKMSVNANCEYQSGVGTMSKKSVKQWRAVRVLCPAHLFNPVIPA